MRLPVFIAAALVTAVAGAAAAKTSISAAEAKRVFFGLDMGGVYEPDGAPWRECITPKGDTRYWFDGHNDIGRLSVRDDGVLCFSYESSGFKTASCYTAERKGQGWRFVNVKDPSIVFLATHALATKACSESAPSA